MLSDLKTDNVGHTGNLHIMYEACGRQFVKYCTQPVHCSLSKRIRVLMLICMLKI